MPNWCYQKLSVSGAETDIAKFKQAYLNHEQKLELNRVIPMPPELDIEEGSVGRNGYDALFGDWKKLFQYPAWQAKIPKEAMESREAYVAWMQETDPAALDLGKKYKSNLDQHGHRNWWSWRIENWGTKWEIGSDQQSLVEENDSSLCIMFETAWSPIHPVLIKMGGRFPDLRFDLFYLDEGGGFAGRFTVRGCDCSDEELEWRGLAEEQFEWDFASEDEEVAE